MELLKQLFAIHSPSGNEVEIRKFIKKWIKSNVDNATIVGDRFGNMYITKGESETYPCVVAHLDQVQGVYPGDYKVVSNDEVIFAYSRSERSMCGLGADDKCGIWIALQILREFDVVKVAFFTGEEVGCVGSSQADMDFFGDTRYVVECDRRGAHDLITSIGWDEICSREFVNAIQPELFGYIEEHGLMTDVQELRRRGYSNSCINVSCGYYEPHSDNEFVIIPDLLNCLDFVRHIVDKCTKVYPNGDDYEDFYDGDVEMRIYDWLDFNLPHDATIGDAFIEASYVFSEVECGRLWHIIETYFK